MRTVFILGLLSAVLLTGCGLKGSLYMPKPYKEPAATQAPAPANPASPADSPTEQSNPQTH